MVACPCCGFDPSDKRPLALGKAIKFTPLERRVFEFYARRFGSRIAMRSLIDFVYADDPDGGPVSAPNVMHVTAEKIRRKIKLHGLVLECGRGRRDGARLMWKEGKAK